MDQVHWVGLSMGGMIGQSIALNHPHRLLGLALCDTSAMIPAEVSRYGMSGSKGCGKIGMKSQLETTMERWFTPLFLNLNLPILTLIKEEFLATPAEGYIGCAEAIRKLNYLVSHEINLPTFIMVGEDDPATPLSASRAIHEQIKNSKLVILPSTRHLSNVEQPRVFNENLVEFLMNVSNKKEKTTYIR